MLFSVSIAYASTPTLSVSPIGDGDSVQVNVTGDSIKVLYCSTRNQALDQHLLQSALQMQMAYFQPQ